MVDLGCSCFFTRFYSPGSDIELNPKVDWDFRDLNLSWLYHEGLAGVMQVGSFNVHLDSKLKLNFVQR